MFMLFCFLYTLVASILFVALRIFFFDVDSGQSYISVTPSVIWGVIFYRIFKKRLDSVGILVTHQQTVSNVNESVRTENIGVQIPETPMDPQEQKQVATDKPPSKKLVLSPINKETTEQTTKKGKSFKLAYIVTTSILAVCVILLSVYSINLSGENSKLAEEISLHKKEISTLRSDISQKKRELDSLWVYKRYQWYFNNVKFANPYSNVYHKVDCYLFDKKEGFYAHNTEHFKAIGVKPCPECCP